VETPAEWPFPFGDFCRRPIWRKSEKIQKSRDGSGPQAAFCISADFRSGGAGENQTLVGEGFAVGFRIFSISPAGRLAPLFVLVGARMESSGRGCSQPRRARRRSRKDPRKKVCLLSGISQPGRARLERGRTRRPRG